MTQSSISSPSRSALRAGGQLPSTASTADGEVLVRVEGVSKKFCRSLKKSLWYGLCDIGAELNPMSRKADKLKVGNSENGSLSASQNVSVSDFSPAAARDEDLRDGEFYAVRDVSFELRRGECLGLIGHNGAGKTTLLKMLNGLIKPDAGKITMRGRVGALIALGAGFNPILTGRENIYINGSVLGLTKKEIDGKMDEIIDFAEIGEFIDSPVQNYSSGMTVRLGFAVATALNPDVLILDEVLAVGDAKFRNKCYNKIGKMHSGAATIFVSHNMEQVAQVCDRVLVMDHGRPCHMGDVSTGVAKYEQLNAPNETDEREAFCSLHKPVTSVDVQLDPAKVRHGARVVLALSITADAIIPDACLRVVFYNEMGVPCAEWNSYRQGKRIDISPGKTTLQVELGPILFKRGEYKLGINLTDSTGTTLLVWSFKEHSVVVDALASVGPVVSFEGELRQLSSL